MSATPGRVQMPDGTTAFYGSTSRSVVMTIIGLLMAVGAVWFFTSGAVSVSGYKRFMVVYFGGPLGAIFAVMGVVRLVVRAPVLVLTDEQLFSISFFGKPKAALSLESIGSVALVRSKQDQIAFTLKDDAPELHEPRWKRDAAAGKYLVGLPAVMRVDQEMLSTPVWVIASEVADRAGCPVEDRRPAR